MDTSQVEYTAQAASPLVNGETKLTITDKSLIMSAFRDAVSLPYSEINALTLNDYVVTVRADSGDYVFSKLGNWCQPFFDTLCEAYNKAVLRSLFVKGAPLVTAKGDYRYTEAARKAGGSAPVYVYDNCVVVLPTNLGARRVPLCFVKNMDKGDFELTLGLDTGESYTWAKLGYDTVPFADGIEKYIRKLYEKSIAALKEIDPSLQTEQATRLARIMPHGAAASFGQINEIAPSLVKALETKIAGTRAAEGYNSFKELCDPSKIYIGFRKNKAAGEEEEGGGGEQGTEQGGEQGVESSAVITDAEEEPEEEQDPYLLWLVAPSPAGQFAAVEFAEPNSATFVYKTGGDFAGFAWQLSRALEAIDFKREVIRLSDEELRKPENAFYYMAAKRTVALKFIRDNFVGRAIHSNPAAWKNKLTELWGES